MPNTPGAERLTPIEIERRTRSFNTRRQQLKSNPSLYISKVRLSVRQIPLFVSERLLKRLASHAIRTFEDEVKKGARVALTEDELSAIAEGENEESAVKEVSEDKKTKGKRKMVGRQTGVRQVKIVRQQERADPVTGKGRSKGYGFIEMHKHADALRVLRWANNNPELGSLFDGWRKDELKDLIDLEKAKEAKDDARLKRMKDELASEARKTKGTLIVEFSIENVQVVHRRSALQKEREVTVRFHRVRFTASV
jgi:nucleolar protein 4